MEIDPLTGRVSGAAVRFPARPALIQIAAGKEKVVPLRGSSSLPKIFHLGRQARAREVYSLGRLV